MSKEKSNQLKVTIYGYDVATIEEATKLITEQLSGLGMVFSGPVPFPTKKKVVTVLTSPHHYGAKEQFSRETHRRKIFIANVSPTDLEKLEKKLKVPNTAHLEFNFS
jgi:small subunit ribosomal protein S10